MRVWDVDPSLLCNKHLNGEHREIHAIHSILLNDKRGYRHHPEVLRWVGKLDALRKRHGEVVSAMIMRGMNHYSPLVTVGDSDTQNSFVNTINEQLSILRTKNCTCKETI